MCYIMGTDSILYSIMGCFGLLSFRTKDLGLTRGSFFYFIIYIYIYFFLYIFIDFFFILLIWIVGIGTLLAGIIGVSNIMLIVVKERTKEIGIQRAIGATPSNIIGQIITESVFLTTLAGYFGLAAGVGILELISWALIKTGAATDMFNNPEVDFNKAITALTILIICGALAGLIPAKRAVSIKPIDALRDE